MDRLGSFRVVGELGRGGMGVVYLGVQDGLGRPVAIKVLPTADDSLAARLRHEADVLADLQHPHVVGIIDVGEVEGRPYLVMPYFAGGTLGDVLRRDGSLRPGQVTGVVAAIADALAAAHARGVLHRDVKPGNVLLSAQGDPYLSDFGIATGSSQTKTSTGELLGTVGYVAPETIAGQPAAAAADVYALGVLAYTALSGRGPVVADNIMAALEAARTGRRMPLQEAAPGAPERLVELVERAMALDPAERPVDLRAWAHELRSAVPPEPVEPAADRAVAMLAADAPTSMGARAAAAKADAEADADTVVRGRRSRRTAVLAGVATAALLATGTTFALLGDGGGAGDTKKIAESGDGSTVVTESPPPEPTSSSPEPATEATQLPTEGAAEPVAVVVTDGSGVVQDAPVVHGDAPPPTRNETTETTTDSQPQPQPKQTTAAPLPPNRAPTLAAIGSSTHDETAGVSITLQGSDPDGGSLTYSASGLPAGLGVSGNRITGTISSAAASVTTDRRKGIQAKGFAVTATVRDSKGATGTRSFTITVRDTHTTMTNYIGKYGCGSSCGESGPDVAALTTPSFSCHSDSENSQPASTIWRQSIAPGTVIRWGVAAKYWYYEPSRTDCENVPRGW